MSMPMPEERPLATVAQATLLGLIGSVPGMGALAGALEGAAAAASRSRMEDWWAMIAARLTSLEVDVQSLVTMDDPEFIAALHRLTRAAQDTADDEKRDRLAAALAHSGSWSSLPSDDRERMERLVVDLSSREVKLLKIIASPRAWLEQANPSAITTYQFANGISFQSFLDVHVSNGDARQKAAVRVALESLQRRGLAIAFDPRLSTTGTAVFDDRASELGHELIDYLQAIGD